MADVRLEQLPQIVSARAEGETADEYRARVLAAIPDDGALYLIKEQGADFQAQVAALRQLFFPELDSLLERLQALPDLLPDRQRDETFVQFQGRARTAFRGAEPVISVLDDGVPKAAPWESFRASIVPTPEELARAQVQSDWTQGDNTSPDYIRNKPAGAMTQWFQGARDPLATDGRENDYWRNSATNTLWFKGPSGWNQIANLTGSDAAVWLTGPADPLPTQGVTGNYFVNTTDNVVFRKDDGVWVRQFQFQGGTNWHFVTTPPNDVEPEGAVLGDLALNTTNGDLWRKDETTWTLLIDLTGPSGTGDAWASGEANPNQRDDLAENATMYFRTSNGTVWQKNSGGAWTQIFTINVAPGTQFLTGTGAPVFTGQNDGTLYLDEDTGELYKVVTGAWVLQTDLTGPTGATVDWLTGVGTPAASLGSDGDFYLRTSNNTIWRKTGGVWSVVTSLAALEVATIYSGSSVPASTFGSDDDLFVHTTTGALYKKITGSWVLLLDLPGSHWIVGTVAPTSATTRADGTDVLTDDFYLNTSNGQFYRWSGSAWQLQGDLTGPSGQAPEITTGSGEPTGGSDGDIYIRSDGTVWKRDGGVWGATSVNLRGADGGLWLSGNGNPNLSTPSFGTEGDWYVRTGSEGGTLWRRTATQWIEQISLNGFDGSLWLSGAGIPAAALGKDTDMYYQTSNGYVWQKSSGSWTFLYDATGAPGTRWFIDSVGPDDSTLVVNPRTDDLYLRTTDAQVFKYQNNAWVEVAALQGADGKTWLTGDNPPTASQGKNGDLYFEHGTGKVYEKVNDSWVFRIDLPGSKWLVEARAPRNSEGNDGDLFYDTTNGYTYTKIAGVWVFENDITGPTGTPGADAVIVDPLEVVEWRGSGGTWTPNQGQTTTIRWYRGGEAVAFATVQFVRPNAEGRIAVSQVLKSTTVSQLGATPLAQAGKRKVVFSYQNVRGSILGLAIKDGQDGADAVSPVVAVPGFHMFVFAVTQSQNRDVTWQTPGHTEASSFRRVRLTARYTGVPNNAATNVRPTLTAATLSGSLGSVSISSRQDWAYNVTGWIVTVAGTSIQILVYWPNI